MTALTHPLVATCEHTCPGSPDQYEGTLVDGRHFYLRYRFGRVQLGLGATIDEAVEETVFGGGVEMSLGGEYAGEFESDEERDTVFTQLLAEHDEYWRRRRWR